jgi:hypothetical protein
MAEHDLILIGVAITLTGYLYSRSWLRDRDCPPEKQWSGHGIDVTGISNRVQRLRIDYVGEVLSRPHRTSRRARLLTLARRTVCGLPYFRSRALLNVASKENEQDHE